jgi:hypothetical protein
VTALTRIDPHSAFREFIVSLSLPLSPSPLTLSLSLSLSLSFPFRLCLTQAFNKVLLPPHERRGHGATSKTFLAVIAGNFFEIVQVSAGETAKGDSVTIIGSKTEHLEF